MSEIDIVEDLLKEYEGKELSEAETRFKIIDVVLHDVLHWPKVSTSVELVVQGNRADYVLKGDSGRALLVIESKKSSKYFELPSTFNSPDHSFKVSVDKLLTNDNIRSAIIQVKEYCEDLICPIGAICNGEVWIIFRVNSSGNKPWKKLPATVIRSLNYFKLDFTAASNLLGYNSVLAENSLLNSIGIAKRVYPEVYFPKNAIHGYDTPVNSNRYAGSLSAISRRYLGPIPIDDKEFMDECYVSNKGQSDVLQKNIHGFLNDSLTPFFKNQGVRDFTDNKEGGAFGLQIVKTIRQENLDNVMILFGGRGSGKSTFLKRFLFHIRPIQIDMHSRVCLVDLIDSSQTTEELANEIWLKVLAGIDYDGHASAPRHKIINLFADEFEIYANQVLIGLQDDSPEYQKLVTDFIQEKLSDTKGFCEKLSLYEKSKNKGLIIFLDNMDQLSSELQDVCYLTAVEIAKKLTCLVIISMREERYFNAKTKGVLDAYHTPGYHLSAPVIPEVLNKRLSYILEKLKFTKDVDLEYGINSDADLIAIQDFFQICKSQITQNNSHLSNFIRYATHGDVRQALEFFQGFLSSGYTNVADIAKEGRWVFQIHQVIKPMMIPDRLFYDEKLSRIPNLFRLRNDVNSSHFTGLRILTMLANKFGDSLSGFVDAKYFVQIFEETYLLKEDCEKHLDVFIAKGIVEANNRLENFSDQIDQIKITAFGNYILANLAFSFSYVDLVCLDSGVFSEELANYLADSANKEVKLKREHRTVDRMEMRLDRAVKFIEYLRNQEDEELEHLGLKSSDTVFTDRLSDSIAIESQKILETVKRTKR